MELETELGVLKQQLIDVGFSHQYFTRKMYLMILVKTMSHGLSLNFKRKLGYTFAVRRKVCFTINNSRSPVLNTFVRDILRVN
jgi:hypothetical protein